MIENEKKEPIKLGERNGYKTIPEENLKDGWVDVDKFLPIPYDLVKLKNNETSKSVPAWWTGSSWDGRRVKRDVKYIYWKRVL